MRNETRPQEYTIGWIAPMTVELTAGRAAFDETFNDGYPLSVSKTFDYFGGKIGAFNVVMAVCAGIGLKHAQSLAEEMVRDFSSIEYFLVVGIGGGVPRYGPGLQEQMVLGDVVVSKPCWGCSGILDYQSGAQGKDGYVINSTVKSPPDEVLRHVNTLASNNAMRYCERLMPRLLETMRSSVHDDYQTDFMDPGSSKDFLYDDDYDHLDDQNFCDNHCDVTRRISRELRGSRAFREPNTPQIHYGVVGSGSTLMISGRKRNEYRDNHHIICFEMEAAGVLHRKEGIVIRGICDYSDSHKNKAWQGYAAATAAAYAKELLWSMSRDRDFQPSDICKEFAASIEQLPESTVADADADTYSYASTQRQALPSVPRRICLRLHDPKEEWGTTSSTQLISKSLYRGVSRWLGDYSRHILCLKVDEQQCLKQVLAVCYHLSNSQLRIIRHRCKDARFKMTIIAILKSFDENYCMDGESLQRALKRPTAELLKDLERILDDGIEGAVLGIIEGFQKIRVFDDMDGPEAISKLCSVFRQYSRHYTRTNTKILLITDGDHQRSLFRDLEPGEFHICRDLASGERPNGLRFH